MIEYYEALEICGNRYSDMIVAKSDDRELYKFVEHQFLPYVRMRNYPLYKLNRWLGYIQGKLIAAGVTTVETERDFTRPLFKHLDFPD